MKVWFVILLGDSVGCRRLGNDLKKENLSLFFSRSSPQFCTRFITSYSLSNLSRLGVGISGGVPPRLEK